MVGFIFGLIVGAHLGFLIAALYTISALEGEHK